MFIFSACGKSANSELVKKLNSSINKIEKNLSKIEEVNENDFLSEELLSFKQVQETFFANVNQKMKDDEFVFAKQNESDTLQNNNQENKEDLNQENTNTNNRNVNTYFENRLPRNVNTFTFCHHICLMGIVWVATVWVDLEHMVVWAEWAVMAEQCPMV